MEQADLEMVPFLRGGWCHRADEYFLCGLGWAWGLAQAFAFRRSVLSVGCSQAAILQSFPSEVFSNWFDFAKNNHEETHSPRVCDFFVFGFSFLRCLRKKAGSVYIVLEKTMVLAPCHLWFGPPPVCFP